MNARNSIIFALLACVLLAIPAVAQEESEAPAMSPEQQAEMMAWMKLAQPGTHHEHLAPFVGTWKGKVQMWMGPEAPEMTEESTAEVAWIMGDRFLEWKQTGAFGGMPYESRTIEGYNNGEERYEAFMIDTFGTLMVFSQGSCSADGKKRVMNTEFNDVIKGGTIKYRTEYEWIDEDHFTYAGFMDSGDGEFQNMLITFERQ